MSCSKGNILYWHAVSCFPCLLLICPSFSSAKQTLDWIHDTGDLYLSTHTGVGSNREETEALLKEHNEFKATAKVCVLSTCFGFEGCLFSTTFLFQETREKVKLLIQLADSLVEKGHLHAADIRGWVTAVDNRYKDFSSRMDKYR